jgi:hypothetical protein
MRKWNIKKFFVFDHKKVEKIGVKKTVVEVPRAQETRLDNSNRASVSTFLESTSQINKKLEAITQ